jgi:hypothetical protein
VGERRTNTARREREGERGEEKMGLAHVMLCADVARADVAADVAKTMVKTARGVKYLVLIVGGCIISGFVIWWCILDKHKS